MGLPLHLKAQLPTSPSEPQFLGGPSQAHSTLHSCWATSFHLSLNVWGSQVFLCIGPCSWLWPLIDYIDIPAVGPPV